MSLILRTFHSLHREDDGFLKSEKYIILRAFFWRSNKSTMCLCPLLFHDENLKNFNCPYHKHRVIGYISKPLFYRYAPKSTLSVSGPVDFGTTVADGKVLTREIAILNRGMRTGEFKIEIPEDCPFFINPTDGTIRPGYSQPLRVRCR